MSDTAHSHDHHGDDAHAHGAGHGHSHEDHEAHYRKIYWILLVLLVLSVGGPFVGAATGIWFITLFFAFGIALVKAYLVVKNFMHLNLEPKFVAYLCSVALAFMGLLFFFVGPDVMEHEGRNWDNVAAKAAVERGGGVHGHGHEATGETEHGEEALPEHHDVAVPTLPRPRPVPQVVRPEVQVAAPAAAPTVAPAVEAAAAPAPPAGMSEHEKQFRAGFIAGRLAGR